MPAPFVGIDLWTMRLHVVGVIGTVAFRTVTLHAPKAFRIIGFLATPLFCTPHREAGTTIRGPDESFLMQPRQLELLQRLFFVAMSTDFRALRCLWRLQGLFGRIRSVLSGCAAGMAVLNILAPLGAKKEGIQGIFLAACRTDFPVWGRRARAFGWLFDLIALSFACILAQTARLFVRGLSPTLPQIKGADRLFTMTQATDERFQATSSEGREWVPGSRCQRHRDLRALARRYQTLNYTPCH